MLVFTRNAGEKFMIGDDVVITIISIKGSQVRVGITAPDHIEVHREEIYKRIHQEKTTDSEE